MGRILRNLVANSNGSCESGYTRLMNERIAFVSTMSGSPWGGSEELWSRAAVDLMREGVRVSASIFGWSTPHERILKLAQVGIHLQSRPAQYPLSKRLWRKMFAAEKTFTAIEVERLLAAESPALVVISDGGILPPIDLLEMCVS